MLEKDPMVTTLEFSKKIAKEVEDMKNILLWSALAGVWIFVLAIMGFIGLFIIPSPTPGTVTARFFGLMMIIGAFGIIFAFTAPIVVLITKRLHKSLGVWHEGFNKFYYTFAIESTLPKGTNPQEKIFNTIQEAFPEIKPFIEKNPNIVQFNAKVQGKKSEHTFDVYSYLYTKGYKEFGELFMRRFDVGKPVDKAEIEKFAGEVEDVYRKHYRPRFRVIVVSTSSFTEDAIEYARNKKVWQTLGLTPDLIVEKPERYKVVWAGGKIV